MKPPVKVMVIDDDISVAESSHQKSFLRNYKDLPVEFVFCNPLDAKDSPDSDSPIKYSVAAALEDIDRHKPDVILQDLDFGEQKKFGFEIAKAAKMMFPTTKVVIHSSREADDPALQAATKAANADGICQKHRSKQYLYKQITGEEFPEPKAPEPLQI